MTRYMSEDEYQAAVERRAKELWLETEMKMPERIRQTWSQGTSFAKSMVRERARQEIHRG